jgi:hypothetical protein
MALLETLSSLLTGKVMAAVAAAAVAGSGAAGASGALPADLQDVYDRITAGSEDEVAADDVEPEDLDLGEETDPVDPVDPLEEADDRIEDEESEPATEELEEDLHAPEATDQEEGPEARSDTATRVLTELGGGCMPEDGDCHFGQAVAARARENGAKNGAKNGELGRANAEQRRADAGSTQARRGAGDEGEEAPVSDEGDDEPELSVQAEQGERPADASKPEDAGKPASAGKPAGAGR